MSRLKLIGIPALLILLCVPASAGAHTWPTWGNNEIDDCTFAAAADWEIASSGYTPNEDRVKSEYLAAAKNGVNGISFNTFAGWWLYRGIGGIHAKMSEVPGEDSLDSPGTLPPTAVSHLKRLLQRYHYLLATMGWYLGHMILLVGYTEQGLVYVSWGEERQMTWLEWREESWGAFVARLSAQSP